MGNYSSKKLRNSTDVFLTQEILKDRKVYDEGEHLNDILVKEIFNGNFSSPIQDILLDSNTKILDVGCGTGFWLMEMAADYQKPRYFGVDALQTFPKSTFPSNTEFLQCDLLKGLPYENNTFDFIHMQYLVHEFTEFQWENCVYKELERVLKPGGWLELCDPNPEFTNGGPISKKLFSSVSNSLKSRSIDPFMIERYNSLIKSISSFSSSTVYREERRFPLSSSDGKIGTLGGLHIKEWCKYILRGPVGKDMQVKLKDIDSVSDKIANEFELHKTYFDVHRFYVQKK